MTVRQVLVGKPGQQPNRWVPWDDVRSCLLGWKGYAIMVAQLMTPGTVAAGELNQAEMMEGTSGEMDEE